MSSYTVIRAGEDSEYWVKTCSIEGCQKQHKAKGMCLMHWQRQRRHGDPRIVLPARKKASTRKCEVPDCHDKHFGKGLCGTHYRIVWHSGTRPVSLENLKRLEMEHANSILVRWGIPPIETSGRRESTS